MAFASWLPLGLALRDYYESGENNSIRVYTVDGEITPYPADLFFRDYEDFSIMDEMGCLLARGRVLDAGAGAGCISIFLQEELDLEVTAIDISKHCVEIMKSIGLKDAREGDVFGMENEQFDTILLLMNGIGFVGNLEGLERFLIHTKTLLAPGGQVLFDSSDLKFADIGDADLRGGPGSYYGEVEYSLEYQDIRGKPYQWLYIDPETLKTIAERQGYEMEILLEADEGYYFCRLTLAEAPQ